MKLNEIRVSKTKAFRSLYTKAFRSLYVTTSGRWFVCAQQAERLFDLPDGGRFWVEIHDRPQPESVEVRCSNSDSSFGGLEVCFRDSIGGGWRREGSYSGLDRFVERAVGAGKSAWITVKQEY